MKSEANIYVDWLTVPTEFTSATLFLNNPEDKVSIVAVHLDRPEPVPATRAELELEVRRHYSMHYSRISKFSTETLIELLKGIGKHRLLKKQKDLIERVSHEI